MERLATPQHLFGGGVLCLKKIKKMTDKLKGFLERHNYKITLTIIKFLKILGKNHCEEAITEI